MRASQANDILLSYAMWVNFDVCFRHRHLLENTRRTRMDCVCGERKNARLSACIWSRSGTCVCVRCIVKLLLIPWKMLLLNSLTHSLFMGPNISIFMGNGKGTGKSSLFLLSFWCVIFGLKSYSPPYYHHRRTATTTGPRMLIHNINLIDALLDRLFHAYIWLVYLLFQCSD